LIINELKPDIARALGALAASQPAAPAIHVPGHPSSSAGSHRIQLLLMRTLLTAIKFLPEGGRIEARAESRDGLVEVAVSEHRVGIAPEDQETVFKEFRQWERRRRRWKVRGWG
jgi:signal transduction histidine kinase